MHVPQIDLRRQARELQGEIAAVVAGACESGVFSGGEEVLRFEREFAGYLGTNEVVAVSSGTAALHLVLRALGVGPGDEVVVPANTFIATAEAVVLAGARPVFCDVEDESGLVSARTVSSAISGRTRALCPVHLFGHVVDMAPVLDLAGRRGLFVIEDAAQAHGARYLDGVRAPAAGTLGHAGCFSFYPTKNLGSVGEGGAVALADPELAERVRALRNHGQRRKHVHDMVGENARMHAIQAGVLRLKLRHLDRWNVRRREIAGLYREGIRDLVLRPLSPGPHSQSVYHQFVVRVPDRERWISGLRERGIETAIHYPTPIHRQPSFSRYGPVRGALPVAESLAGEILSLPMFAELTDREVSAVIEALRDLDRERVPAPATARGIGRA